MKDTPIDYSVVQTVIDKYNLPDFGKATIREVVDIANKIEKVTGKRFIRMEMGVPGLPASQIGIQAEIEALKNGVASVYPPLAGTTDFKKQASRFVKAFIDVDVPEDCCTPVTGSMQGTMASFITCSQRDKSRNTVFVHRSWIPGSKITAHYAAMPVRIVRCIQFQG